MGITIDCSTVASTDTHGLGDWRGTCGAGHATVRHRRPRAPMECRACVRAGAPHATALLRWTYRGRQVPMPSAYRTAERQLLAS
ncbi:hypothetical protein [Serinibacter salmoneus]|uniref:Uncharacterized protein n=1 Tax=Serinibacter salmoneus TaxID=556530 RepID=A0A2A9D2W8_9MICO|nr:hypothetical protein [Serinibacter salmoneus]PFG21047.1 hypothetical protein ATL40_2667 [Serinibacter salmoneus]